MTQNNTSKIQKIEIPQSRKKNLLLLLGSLLFVFGGYYMWLDSKHFMGMAAILFFGLGVIVAIVKLLDKRKGVIIDSKGVTDNTSVISVGLIEWADIIELRPTSFASEFFVLVHVSNPEKYIKSTNKIKSFLMGRNLKKFGSPITIANGTLKSSDEYLYNVLSSAFQQYKENQR